MGGLNIGRTILGSLISNADYSNLTFHLGAEAEAEAEAVCEHEPPESPLLNN